MQAGYILDSRVMQLMHAPPPPLPALPAPLRGRRHGTGTGRVSGEEQRGKKREATMEEARRRPPHPGLNGAGLMLAALPLALPPPAAAGAGGRRSPRRRRPHGPRRAAAGRGRDADGGPVAKEERPNVWPNSKRPIWLSPQSRPLLLPPEPLWRERTFPVDLTGRTRVLCRVCAASLAAERGGEGRVRKRERERERGWSPTCLRWRSRGCR